MKIRKQKKLTSEEIIGILKKHSDILQKHKVTKIGLFGSYAKGGQKRKSDIDFLVEFDYAAFDKNFTGYSENYDALSASLKRLLGRKIDLVSDDMISPYIKPYVLKEVRYIEAG